MIRHRPIAGGVFRSSPRVPCGGASTGFRRDIADRRSSSTATGITRYSNPAGRVRGSWSRLSESTRLRSGCWQPFACPTARFFKAADTKCLQT